jgi:hypothetical protein
MKIQFIIYTLLLVPIFTNQSSFAQTKSKEAVSDFSITASINEKGILLESSKGCAWTELNFTVTKEQGIDNFGMSEGYDSDQKASFYFTLVRTKTGLKLTGLKGTAWKELSFVVQNHKKYLVTASGVKAL